MMRLIELSVPNYFYAPNDSDNDEYDPDPGALFLKCDNGDTLLPPHNGRYTWLDSVTDEDDAELMAQSWGTQ